MTSTKKMLPMAALVAFSDSIDWFARATAEWKPSETVPSMLLSIVPGIPTTCTPNASEIARAPRKLPSPPITTKAPSFK